MKVTILNPEVLENLYENHGKFACVCYATDESKAEGVGKHCQDNNHMSGSRCEYIKFKISDVDRGTAEQALRHEIGTSVPYDLLDNYDFSSWMDRVVNVNPSEIVKNMASFRYINKTGFNYVIPDNIANHENTKTAYTSLMKHICDYRDLILKMLLEHGVGKKLANEEVNFVLPRATTTEFVIGFSPEALIHFCHKRLCKRAQPFIQTMAKLMKAEVAKYNARFANNELKPQCAHLLWCPEGKQSCGMFFTRKQLEEKLKELN